MIKIFTAVLLSLCSLTGFTQWTAGSNNSIYYPTGNVGVNTSSPQAALDVNGTMQMKSNGAADATNTYKSSNIITLQSSFWETTTQYRNWNIYNKQHLGVSANVPNVNKSRLAITQHDGTERFIVDDNGDFSMNNQWGGNIFYFDNNMDRVNMSSAFWAGQIVAGDVGVVILRGRNWGTTYVRPEGRGLKYNASCECGDWVTAHQFSISNPLALATSNIATFDNGGVPLVRIDKDGNFFAKSKVAIGDLDVTDIGNFTLAVNGDARFNKAVVRVGNWPDYVFDKNYDLKTLEQIEGFIKSNKHLPGVPSASEVKENGVEVGETQAILLKKIEELTLHLIEVNKKVNALIEENKTLKSK